MYGLNRLREIGGGVHRQARARIPPLFIGCFFNIKGRTALSSIARLLDGKLSRRGERLALLDDVGADAFRSGRSVLHAVDRARRDVDRVAEDHAAIEIHLLPPCGSADRW